MRLALAALLLMTGCASAAPDNTPQQETKAQEHFFDCLTRLGADQSKGIAACEKLL